MFFACYFITTIISISLFAYFIHLSKKFPDKYSKLLKNINEKNKEFDKYEKENENNLNLFKNDKYSENYFMSLSLLVFPIINLFLCYTLIQNIKFLKHDN